MVLATIIERSKVGRDYINPDKLWNDDIRQAEYIDQYSRSENYAALALPNDQWVVWLRDNFLQVTTRVVYNRNGKSKLVMSWGE